MECCRQGLCYNCDEPFVRAHQCKHLFYLVANEDPTDAAEDDVVTTALLAKQRQPTTDDIMEPVVSLYAIVGVRTKDTMQVPIYIHGHNVVALFNSSSTLNFVHMGVIRHIGLATTDANLRVMVGNGDHVPCGAVARNMAMNIRGLHHHLFHHRLGSIRPRPRHRLPHDPGPDPVGL